MSTWATDVETTPRVPTTTPTVIRTPAARITPTAFATSITPRTLTVMDVFLCWTSTVQLTVTAVRSIILCAVLMVHACAKVEPLITGLRWKDDVSSWITTFRATIHQIVTAACSVRTTLWDTASASPVTRFTDTPAMKTQGSLVPVTVIALQKTTFVT